MCVVAGAVGSPNTIGLAYCNSTVTRQCAAGVNANSIRQVCTFRCGSGLLPAFIYDNDLCQRFIEFFTPKHKCMHVVFVAAPECSERQAGRQQASGRRCTGAQADDYKSNTKSGEKNAKWFATKNGSKLNL